MENSNLHRLLDNKSRYRVTAPKLEDKKTKPNLLVRLFMAVCEANHPTASRRPGSKKAAFRCQLERQYAEERVRAKLGAPAEN